MNKEFSIYLDLVRFVAAMLVVVAHSYGQSITGGVLWQLSPFGKTAVIIFFVLSGYVIAFVTDTREKNIYSYGISRVSRIYSVVVPAVCFTYVCNYLGGEFVHIEFIEPWYHYDASLINYALSIPLLQNIWQLGLNPPNNGSMWSLTYELVYYILFAVFYFVPNKCFKILLFILVSCVAGPAIISLFPIWLAGYFLYKMHSRLDLKRENFSFLYLVIWIASIAAMVIGGPELVKNYQISNGFLNSRIIADYYEAICFSVHLFVTPTVIQPIKRYFIKYQKVIVTLGSLTFVLYLFHMPYVRLMSVLSPFSDKSSVFNVILVYAGVLLLAYIGTFWCDKLKVLMKSYCQALVPLRYKK